MHLQKLFLIQVSDLDNIYYKTLDSLGLQVERSIHTIQRITLYKQRIPAQIEDFGGCGERGEVISLPCAANIDYDHKGKTLAGSAHIIRGDIFSHQQDSLSGGFETECQEHLTLKSLQTIIAMIPRRATSGKEGEVKTALI